jgi:hypothetical protein
VASTSAWFASFSAAIGDRCAIVDGVAVAQGELFPGEA